MWDGDKAGILSTMVLHLHSSRKYQLVEITKSPSHGRFLREARLRMIQDKINFEMVDSLSINFPAALRNLIWTNSGYLIC